MQPNKPTERTYTFVDDPYHKQNPSGRVQQACLPCRKKKTKCSGVVPCRQCTERGFPCDGPPSRKRRKRDCGTTSKAVAPLVNVAIKQAAAGEDRCKQFDEERPQKSASIPRDGDDGDSGYRSNATSSQWPPSLDDPLSEKQAGATQPGTAFVLEPPRTHSLHKSGSSTFQGHNSIAVGSAPSAMPPACGFSTSVASRYPCPANASPTSAREDWGFMSDSRFPSQFFEPTTHGMSEKSHSARAAHATSAAYSAAGSKVGDGRSSRDWCNTAGGMHRLPFELISEAEALEEALNLRQIASKRQSEASHDNARGSSPQSPLQPRSLGLVDDPMQPPLFDPGIQPYSFDSSAVFRGDGTFQNGSAPNGANESSFLGDIGSAIGIGTTPVTDFDALESFGADPRPLAPVGADRCASSFVH